MGSASSVDDLGSAASFLRAIADTPGSPPRGPLEPGQIVAGKYRVVGPIGAGGMGIVYLARDLRLQRDVALKLGTACSTAALARVEREAQALARITHPNIVVVYEVGEVDGRVFVAMEYVAGGTARAWLTVRTAAGLHSTAEILALYCAAGDGLAAAHAAGIVHRDFKPDNVLVGDDGRPRVVDFGLSLAVLEPEARPHTARADTGVDPTVTRASALSGTLAYMPPEQLDGGEVDGRADQFSYAVAVWEALYGIRPFEGHTRDELLVAIRSAPPRTTAPDARAQRVVPREVEAALRTALYPEPDDRWPTIAALVAALRRDPARRRRNVALVAAMVLAASAIAIAYSSGRGRVADPCSGGAAGITVAWNAPHADAVRAAFATQQLDNIGRATVTALDEYARRWVAADRAVCEAEGRVSDRLRERASGCLDARRDDLAAAADLLDSADHDTASHAGEIVSRLAPPERCTAMVLEVSPITPSMPFPPKATLCTEAHASAARTRGDPAIVPQGISLWDGDFGAHVIQRVGDEVWAAYEHDTGLFYGRIEHDHLAGWWCERPHQYPGDNGAIEMNLVSDGSGHPTLDGRFQYGDRGDWHDDWDVTPAPWSSCSEQTAARLVAFDWECPMPAPRPAAPPHLP